MRLTNRAGHSQEWPALTPKTDMGSCDVTDCTRRVVYAYPDAGWSACDLHQEYVVAAVDWIQTDTTSVRRTITSLEQQISDAQAVATSDAKVAMAARRLLSSYQARAYGEADSVIVDRKGWVCAVPGCDRRHVKYHPASGKLACRRHYDWVDALWRVVDAGNR